MLMTLLQAPATAAYLLAAAHGCAAPKPQLDFDFSVKKTVYVHTVGGRALARMKAKDGSVSLGMLSGLTENEFSRNLAIYGKEERRRDGWYCFAPVKVVAKLELKPTVYISSSYSPSSCRYRATREHELQHVKIATDTLEEYSSTVLARLRRAVAEAGAAGPSAPRELKRGRQRIVKALNAAYAEVMAEMERKLAERQARIDTKDEYRRVGNLCPGEPY